MIIGSIPITEIIIERRVSYRVEGLISYPISHRCNLNYRFKKFKKIYVIICL